MTQNFTSEYVSWKEIDAIKRKKSVNNYFKVYPALPDEEIDGHCNDKSAIKEHKLRKASPARGQRAKNTSSKSDQNHPGKLG